jgi:hypothetical protein
MLMMDRITDISGDGGAHGKGHVVAEFDITPDLWFFDCHFPGNPIMPGCLGLDGLWQLTGFNLGWRGWQGRGLRAGRGRGEADGHGAARPQDADLQGGFHQGDADPPPDDGRGRRDRGGRWRGDLPGQGHEGHGARAKAERSKTDLGFIGVPSAATTRISGRTGLLGMWSMAD